MRGAVGSTPAWRSVSPHLLEIVAVLEAGDQLREPVERVRLEAEHLAHLAHGEPACAR